jgi:tetratricopeptide (TPR) repeat protein
MFPKVPLYWAALVVAPALHLLAVPANPAAPQARDAVFDSAMKREEIGDFCGALQQLNGAKASELNALQREHMLHLRAFVAISPDSCPFRDEYAEAFDASEKAKSLKDLLTKLDPDNDRFLLRSGYDTLYDLDAKSVSWYGSPPGQWWHHAVGALEARDPGRLPLSALLDFLIPLAVLIYLFWRIVPRGGFLISFEDLTVESPSKTQRDRRLTQEIHEAFWVPRAEHTYGGMDLRVFAINDHDGSSFSTLVPNKTLAVWSDIVQSNVPIKVGPVELNLKDTVALLLGWLQTPRRDALVGFLHKSQGETVITAQKLDKRRRPVAGLSWKVTAESKRCSERDLIQDLVSQMLVDLHGTRLTTSWRSYRDLLRGIALLDKRPTARDGCDCFENARQQLQNALDEDPANYLARFYLAIALRRCGANEEAAQHLTAVAQLFASVEKQLAGRSLLHIQFGSKSLLERHLWQYPECGFIVLYNLAMALSKSHTFEAMDRALELLSLIVSLCCDQKPEPTILRIRDKERDIPDLEAFRYAARRLARVDRRRFASVAMSGQAVVWAAQAEFCGNLSPQTLLHEVSEIQTRLDDLTRKGNWLAIGRHNDASDSLHSARATTWCAKGKIQSVLGQSADARESFARALLLVPNMVDAYLNLAASYINDHGQGEAWAHNADRALQRALVLDPTCPRARYLLGRLAFERSTPDCNEALKQVQKTEPLAEGYFLRAEVHARISGTTKDFDDCLKAWRQGLEQLPLAISRDHYHHIIRLTEVARENPSNSELRQMAREAERRSASCAWQPPAVISEKAASMGAHA